MRNFWNLEKCIKAVSTCNSRKDFKLKYSGAYSYCIRNGLLNEVFKDIKMKTIKGYWTFNRCLDVAKLCKSRSEFYKKYGGAYKACVKNGWLDIVCIDMIKIGNISKRSVYLIKFDEETVYIGLSFNVEQRFEQHLSRSNSNIKKYLESNICSPILIKLSDYIPSNQASDLEKYYIKYYKENGFKVLNRKEGGGLGRESKKWDYDSCKTICEQYETKTKLRNNSFSCYSFCKENNLLDIFYPDNPKKLKLNYDICKKESMKYKLRTEFSKNSRTIYNFASKNGWLKEFFE
jgi:predicted GIY-YIG superfamily endonuclease